MSTTRLHNCISVKAPFPLLCLPVLAGHSFPVEASCQVLIDTLLSCPFLPWSSVKLNQPPSGERSVKTRLHLWFCSPPWPTEDPLMHTFSRTAKLALEEDIKYSVSCLYRPAGKGGLGLNYWAGGGECVCVCLSLSICLCLLGVSVCHGCAEAATALIRFIFHLCKQEMGRAVLMTPVLVIKS